MAAGVSIEASSYASQTTGWRVTDAGEADFRYLYVDEMHAKSFIADLEQALAGGQIIAKSVAQLYSNFTAPAAGGSQSALKRTGRRVNLLKQVLHISHRFQPVAQTMTNARITHHASTL